MEAEDIYLKRDKVFVFDNNVLVEADYDSIGTGIVYFVVTKTHNFSLYRKTEKFDDTFIKSEKSKIEAENYLKNNAPD